MIDRRRVFFELDQDASGYPPVATESLWAIPTEVPSQYVLDNIPFFEKVATIGDRISVEEVDGRLWHRATVRRTDHSLIRVVGLDGNDPAPVGKELEGLGCSWESNAVHHLISVDVPSEPLRRVQAIVAMRATTGSIDHEEAILR